MTQQRGDARELYAACYSRLVGIVAVTAGDRAEAEDVVQEAFVRLLQHWPKVADYDDPEAWVRSVAFRLLLNRRRRLGYAVSRLPFLRPEPPPPPRSDRIDVERALAAIPLAQRQVVVLHHLCDLPVEDVATQLRLPVGTVKSRLARARTRLAELLAVEEVTV